MAARVATRLETVWVDVPEPALEAYEAALATACGTVGFFHDEATGAWRVEGVKEAGEGEAELAAALALAEAATGAPAALQRQETEAEGWLARTLSSFPEQLVGSRFAVRGTHLDGKRAPGRLTLLLDAGIAFGSGEHGSTRGCLRAFERVARRRAWEHVARRRACEHTAHRRPRRILDLGTGSGILAMAAAAVLHRPVLATDIDPWSVRVTAENARLNGLDRLVRAVRADGWRDRIVRAGGPYDLVFANILARPLCAMAHDLAAHLAPGGTAILAGLLETQGRMVLAAHRRQGLVLDFSVAEGRWTTLVLRAGA